MKADSQNRSLEEALSRLNNSVEIIMDIADKRVAKNEKNDSTVVDALQKLVKQGDDAKEIAKEQRSDKTNKSKTLDTLKQMSLADKKSGAKFNVTNFIKLLGKSAKKLIPSVIKTFAKVLGGVFILAVMQIGSIVSSIGNKVSKAISNGLEAVGGLVNGAFAVISNGLNALQSILPQSLQKVLGPAFTVLSFAIAGVKKAFNVAFNVVKNAWKVFSESLIGKLLLGIAAIYLVYKFFTSDAITTWIGEKLTMFYNNLQNENGVFGKIAGISLGVKDFIKSVADKIGELVILFTHSGGLGRYYHECNFWCRRTKSC